MNNKKRIVHVICSRFLDFKTGDVVIGGVETYLSNLLPLFENKGFQCKIYQFSEKDERGSHGSYTIHAVGGSEINGKRDVTKLLKAAEKTMDNDADVLLFADHWMTVANQAKMSLSIQHGIHWDIPNDRPRNDLKMSLSSARFTYNEDKKLSYVKKVICVDYNFPNWYRAQVDKPKTQLIVIPNFSKIADISDNQKSKDENLNIIFARRLVPYRGTRVFANAIDRILNKHNSIHVTVAGSGPDANYMHSVLDKWESKVDFIQYTADQSLEIHKSMDIAVIPTVGSEGTSLSLLEAMASKCAVICTDVGGMTNIVIDDYNGLMVEAGNEDKLFEAIETLIADREKLNKLSARGYETVKEAFSLDKWKKRWSLIIEEL